MIRLTSFYLFIFFINSFIHCNNIVNLIESIRNKDNQQSKNNLGMQKKSVLLFFI